MFSNLYVITVIFLSHSMCYTISVVKMLSLNNLILMIQLCAGVLVFSLAVFASKDSICISVFM
jgi:hypothetical protein